MRVAHMRPNMRLLASRPIAERYAEAVESRLVKLGDGEVKYKEMADVMKAAAADVQWFRRRSLHVGHRRCRTCRVVCRKSVMCSIVRLVGRARCATLF